MMLVFDGMGGHSDGARAAEVGPQGRAGHVHVIADLPVFDPQGFLYTALAQAHDEVVNIGSDLNVDFRPRATCAICLIQEDGSVLGAHRRQPHLPDAQRASTAGRSFARPQSR